MAKGKGKTKQQLADESYRRVYGDPVEMFEVAAVPVEPGPAAPLHDRLPPRCGGCGVTTGVTEAVAEGRMSPMRLALSEADGWLQCDACAHRIRVTRPVWDAIALRRSRALTDTPRGANRPKPGREQKYDRGTE